MDSAVEDVVSATSLSDADAPAAAVFDEYPVLAMKSTDVFLVSLLRYLWRQPGDTTRAASNLGFVCWWRCSAFHQFRSLNFNRLFVAKQGGC